MPGLLNDLGCDVIELNSHLQESRSGTTPEQAERALEQLSRIVVTLGATVGFWLGPSGERLKLIDETGEVLSDIEALSTLAALVGQAERSGGRAVATSPDGSLVFVTASGSDLAYDAATGTLRWEAPNGTSGASGAVAIGTSPSDSMVVSAGAASFPDGERILSDEIVVTARDPATGLERWQARHRAANNEAYTASALAVGDERLFVAGQRVQPGERFHVGAPPLQHDVGAVEHDAAFRIRQVLAHKVPVDGMVRHIVEHEAWHAAHIGLEHVALDLAEQLDIAKRFAALAVAHRQCG